MAICPNCGQTIPDHSRFCPCCGTDIQKALEEQARYVRDVTAYPPETTPRGGYGRALASLVLSLIGLGCFASGALCVIFAVIH